MRKTIHRFSEAYVFSKFFFITDCYQVMRHKQNAACAGLFYFNTELDIVQTPAEQSK